MLPPCREWRAECRICPAPWMPSPPPSPTVSRRAGHRGTPWRDRSRWAAGTVPSRSGCRQRTRSKCRPRTSGPPSPWRSAMPMRGLWLPDADTTDEDSAPARRARQIVLACLERHGRRGGGSRPSAPCPPWCGCGPRAAFCRESCTTSAPMPIPCPSGASIPAAATPGSARPTRARRPSPAIPRWSPTTSSGPSPASSRGAGC